MVRSQKYDIEQKKQVTEECTQNGLIYLMSKPCKIRLYNN